MVNDLQADLVIVEPGNSYEERTVLSQEWTAALETFLCRFEMGDGILIGLKSHSHEVVVIITSFGGLKRFFGCI